MQRGGSTSRVRGVRGVGRRAFSLFEVLLVLGIIGITASIALPRIGGSLEYQRVDGAARMLAADLEFARRDAMSSSATRRFTYRPGAADGYEIEGVDRPSRPGEPYLVRPSLEGFEVEFVSVDFGSDAEPLTLEFDMYGAPDSAGSVTLRSGQHTRVVSVSEATGEVEITR